MRKKSAILRHRIVTTMRTQEIGNRELTVSPHSFRHSYRAWLDELGTPITVQQRAMRHGDIRVTMSYGEAVGDALREASSKVAARAIPQKRIANGLQPT